MSGRVSASDTDDSEREPGEVKESSQAFQFIDLSNRDPDSRKENRTKARSHVMKFVRRRARTEQKQHEFIVLSPTELTAILNGLRPQTLSVGIDQNLLARANSPSPWSRIGEDIIPILTSEWGWSSLAHDMVHYMVTVVIATLFPTNSAGKPTAAAIEAWNAIRSSRMVIHAVTCGAAAYRDSQRPTTELSKSREALAHRGEALRLINDEVSDLREGEKPSDALIFAVLAMTAEPHDDSSQAMDMDMDTDNPPSHPFRLPHMPRGWEQTFLPVRYSQVHHRGLFALVERRGGLSALQNRALAKMISDHDVLLAAEELRAPRQPFVQVDEIGSLASDLSLNVLELDDRNVPGRLLPALQHSVGASTLLASVLAGLQRVVATADALACGALRNPNVPALNGDKEAVHHAILSIPPRPYPVDGSLYEPVRLVVLVFDVGILFPLPPATGAFARLVQWMKAALESISLEVLSDGMAKALTWILFVGGVAAKGQLERVWYIERLSDLVEWQGMTRWNEVKQLLRNFIWMADAMDEEAMDLWDDIRCHGRA